MAAMCTKSKLVSCLHQVTKCEAICKESVYLYIHRVTHVTMDTSITVYNLYIKKHNL